MERACGGWIRTGFEDFKPIDKYRREDSRQKNCLEELMKLCFEKSKNEFDAPKLGKIAKNSIHKKRKLKKQDEYAQKISNVIHSSDVR